MKTVNKFSGSKELFPYSFSYKSSKEPQNELPNHMHDFYEIIYVHSGKGVFFIHNTLYEMGKGDVFIIPNDTIHHSKPDKDDLVTSSVIFFSPALIQTFSIDESFSYLSLIEKIKKEKDYKMHLYEEEQAKLEQYLVNIYQELKEKELGSSHASVLITHQILLELSRLRVKQHAEPSIKEDNSRDWINDIFSFIDQHLHQHISLTTLANEALVSPAHFSRAFKQITGMGLTVYVNKKRIFKAKELLIYTHYTISYIAEKCGFESTPHFYRTFKKYIGTTPAHFRKGNMPK